MHLRACAIAFFAMHLLAAIPGRAETMRLHPGADLSCEAKPGAAHRRMPLLAGSKLQVESWLANAPIAETSRADYLTAKFTPGGHADAKGTLSIFTASELRTEILRASLEGTESLGSRSGAVRMNAAQLADYAGLGAASARFAWNGKTKHARLSFKPRAAKRRLVQKYDCAAKRTVQCFVADGERRCGKYTIG